MGDYMHEPQFCADPSEYLHPGGFGLGCERREHRVSRTAIGDKGCKTWFLHRSRRRVCEKWVFDSNYGKDDEKC